MFTNRHRAPFIAILVVIAASAGGQALVPSLASAMDEAGGDSGSATTCPLSRLIWDIDTDSYVCDPSKEGGGSNSSGTGADGSGRAANGSAGGRDGAGRDNRNGATSGGWFGDLIPSDYRSRDIRKLREELVRLNQAECRLILGDINAFTNNRGGRKGRRSALADDHDRADQELRDTWRARHCESRLGIAGPGDD